MEDLLAIVRHAAQVALDDVTRRFESTDPEELLDALGELILLDETERDAVDTVAAQLLDAVLGERPRNEEPASEPPRVPLG